MNTGQAISGVAHVGLITWVFVSGSILSQKAPPPPDLTEVTTITASEFEELLAIAVAPEALAEVAGINSPEAEEAPLLPGEAEDAPLAALPEAANAPDLETAPELETVVVPDIEVDDEIPILEPVRDGPSHDFPDISAEPQVRPAENIAPEPFAQPEPETELAEVEQDAVSPDLDSLIELPEREATAPEEAAVEIVTEAEEASEITSAPLRAIRPVSRPVQPEINQEPDSDPDLLIQPEPDEEPLMLENEGQSGRPQTVENELPTGAPLTATEKDSLRTQIQKCWNTYTISSAALEITVVIAASLDESGKPDPGSVRLLSHDGKSEGAAQQAFQAGKRAIIRCGTNGYDLPVEKYGRWREIEITFNPEKMRNK